MTFALAVGLFVFYALALWFLVREYERSIEEVDRSIATGLDKLGDDLVALIQQATERLRQTWKGSDHER
jgi:F0F1-type ATP synthase membrane subunit b/b'